MDISDDEKTPLDVVRGENRRRNNHSVEDLSRKY
jgi:hypothetical protein